MRKHLCQGGSPPGTLPAPDCKPGEILCGDPSRKIQEECGTFLNVSTNNNDKFSNTLTCISVEYFSDTVRVTPEGGDRFEEVPAMKVIPGVVPSYQNLKILVQGGPKVSKRML